MTLRAATAADAQAIAEVMVATWRSSYAGLLPDQFLESMSVDGNRSQWLRILEDWSGSSCVFVAEEAGRIVGFASGGRERELDPRYLGELYSIYILAEHQGRGIGRRLAGAVAAWLIGRGMASMMVWVLEGNSSGRGFYERLGGAYIREVNREVLALAVTEVGYGWEDAATLVPPG